MVFDRNRFGAATIRQERYWSVARPPELNRSLGGAGDADALLGADALLLGGGVLVGGLVVGGGVGLVLSGGMVADALLEADPLPLAEALPPTISRGVSSLAGLSYGYSLTSLH